MAHTYDELKQMTVAQLKEVAEGIEHDAVHGYRTMHKEKLLQSICQALSIDAHAHHEVVGIDKRTVKDQIKTLKKDRDTAIEAGDHVRLKQVRRRIHRLKRRIHKSTV